MTEKIAESEKNYSEILANIFKLGYNKIQKTYKGKMYACLIKRYEKRGYKNGKSN